MSEDLRLDSLEGVGPVTTKKLGYAVIQSIIELIVRGQLEISYINLMDR